MEIRYNVTGAKRKELVNVISKATGMKAVYKFMPTCNFEIGSFTVNKEGTLLIDAQTDNEEVARCWRPLRQQASNLRRRILRKLRLRKFSLRKNPFPLRKMH